MLGRMIQILKSTFKLTPLPHRPSGIEFTPDLQIHVDPDRGDGVSLMGALRIAL